MKTTNHTLAGLRTVAIVLASLFASMAAQAANSTGLTDPAVLGTNAVALGQKSAAIGKGSLAVGNGASEQEVRALIDKSRGIQDKINGLQASIDGDTKRYGSSLETLERVERNQKRIAELSTTLAENQKLLREKQALLEQQTRDYNTQKEVVEQKSNILANLSTGEFAKAWENGGIDGLAKVTKEKVEAGTSINNSTEFYKDYVDTYVKNKTIINDLDAALGASQITPYKDKYIIGNNKEFIVNPLLAGVFNKATTLDSTEVLNQKLNAAKALLSGKDDFKNDVLSKLNERIENNTFSSSPEVNKILKETYNSKKYQDYLSGIAESIGNVAKDNAEYVLQLNKVNALDKKNTRYPAEFKKLLDIEKRVKDAEKRYPQSGYIDENDLTGDVTKKMVASTRDTIKENLINSIKRKNKESSDKILSDLNATLDVAKNKVDETSSAIATTDKAITALQTNIDTLAPTAAELSEYEKAKVLKKNIDDNTIRVIAERKNLTEVQKNMNNGTGATAVGAGSIAIGKNSVALGADTVASRENSVDVGNRQITSVADGTEKHDAVNKGQLDTEANARIEGDKLALTHANNYTDGREKAINTRTDGLVKTEQNARIEGDKQTLTSANAYTDGREKVINSRTDGLIKREQTDRSAAIKAEAAARVQGDTQTLAAAKAHSDAGDVKTLNSANSYTDASSKSTLKKANNYTDNRFEHFGTQISNDVLEKSYSYTERRSVAAENNAVRRANTYTDSKFGQLNTKIEQAEKRFNAGIAGVTAIASIPYVSGNTFSYGLAVGNYRNGNALAGGVQYKTSPNTNVRLNVSWDSSGNAALGAGLAGGW